MSVNKNCVLYVEPNYNTEMQEKFGEPHYVHDAEDYCIYVDLQVQIYDNETDGVNEIGSKTIHWSWKSNSDGNTTASFMQGKKFKYQNGSKDNFYALTTDYVDTYFDDVIRDSKSEENVNPQCFGIESINISFDNYTVPCVDIDFTDIRGASMFAPEEYRHSKTTNGVGGLAKDDISGSFFKSFMSIPYPKYVLYVKGFYGEPVSYQLTCDKFNAKFDSKTGNFGAHAHFVGYAFSMLTDISLNALVAAPLSDYVGRSYWENSIRSNEEYRLLSPNGSNEVITLTDLMKNLAKMKQTLNEENKDKDDASKELTTVLSILKNIESNYVDIFFDRFQTDEYLVSKPNGFAYLTNKDKYPKDIDVAIDDLNAFINSNQETLKKYCPNLQKLPKPKRYASFAIKNEEGTKSIKDEYKDLKEVVGRAYVSAYEKQNLGNFNDCYFFDGRTFYNILVDAIQTLNNKKKENDKKLFSTSDSAEKYVTQLGFYPSVSNFIKIILAHLETFLAIIYNVKNEVNTLNSSDFTKRTLSDFGITTNEYVDFKQISDTVPAFPKVTTKEIGGNGNAVDGWIGDFPTNGELQPEANAVNGLLNAVKNVETFVQQLKVEDEYDHKFNSVFKTPYITVPLTIQDFINDGNPWGNEPIVADDIDVILSKMFMRGINVMYSFTDRNSDKRGTYDALNFYKVYGKQMSNRLKQMFNTMVGDDYKNIITNVTNRIIKNNAEYFTTNLLNSARFGSYFPIVNESLTTSLEHSEDVNDFAISDSYREQNPMAARNNDNYLYIDEDVDKYENLNYDNSALLSASLDAENYKDEIFDDELASLSYSNDKVYDEYGCFTNDLNGRDGYNEDITLVHISPKFVDKQTLLEKDFVAFSGSGVFNSTKDMSGAIASFPILANKQLVGGKQNKPHINLYDSSDFKDYTYKIQNEENKIDLSKVDYKTVSDTYTVNSIRYINSKHSLYLEPQYYATNSLEQKAFMFLDNCIYHDLDEFNKLYKDKKVFYSTKICALLCGAYLKLDTFNRRIGRRNLDAITAKFSKLHKEYFISYFEKWVKEEYSLFDKAFSLHKANGDSYTVDDVQKLRLLIASDSCNIIDFYKLLDDGFFKNYTATSKEGLLLFRQSSPIVQRLTELYFQPILVVKPLYVTDWSNKELPFYNGKINRRLESYIRDFCQELTVLFKNDLSFKEVDTSQVENDVTTPKEIKIGLYKYLKIIHDKWLGSTEQSFWKASNFIKYWHFIDTFYNDISTKCIINPLQIDRELKNSQMDINVTLITLITNVLADSNVALHTVHNFIDLNSKNYVESMENMFKPIPLIEMREPTEEPHFVCIYCGESSSKLDIPNSNFKDDSFMLNDDNVLPKAVLSKMNTHECPIPAFGVTFGSDYQSYFTDISVNTESPITTEQSLKAQFMIAGMNNASAENQKEVYYLGQDLFTVYANNSYTCEVTMMGCAWIQPLMYFCLMNVPMFHGSYMITKVSHSITTGNMVTKFVGTRMANTMTPFVENPIGGTENNEDFEIERIKDIQGKYAKYDNDCPYKKYPVFVGANGNGVTNTLLNEHNGYTKYCYVLNETLGSENKYDTILDALTATALAECGDNDMLQVKLVATVMFNRWVKGKGFHKYIFNGSQLAYNRFSSYDDTDVYSNRDTVREIVRNIFVNTPSVLLGEQLITEVDNPTQIYANNVLTDEMTKSTEITKDMLTHMFMFCTRDSYDKSNPRPNGLGPVNSLGQPILVKYPEHFRKQRFLVQHKNHVYTSGDWDLMYWDTNDIESDIDSIDSNGISKFGNKLIEALEKTAKMSNALISEKEWHLDAKALSDDEIELTLNDDTDGKLGKIFDMLVNAYGDEIKYVKWNLANDGDVTNESPNNIIVKPNPNKEDELKIYIGDFDNIPTNVNRVFLSSLSKRYDIANGLKYLRMDCPQTSYMTDIELTDLFKPISIEACDKVVPKNEYDDVFELDGVDFNMKELLSEHFTLGMLCGNGKGTINGNVRGYYYPKTNVILNNLKHLAMYAEKVNNIYKAYLSEIDIETNKDVVIRITSGYRYPYNGNTSSQHVDANAIDIVPLVGNTRNLFDALFDAVKNKDLQCGQLIWEYTTNQDALRPTLVHISDEVTRSNAKNQSFKYQQGLNASKATSSLASEYTTRMVNNRLIVNNTDTTPFYL